MCGFFLTFLLVALALALALVLVLVLVLCLVLGLVLDLDLDLDLDLNLDLDLPLFFDLGLDLGREPKSELELELESELELELESELELELDPEPELELHLVLAFRSLLLGAASAELLCPRGAAAAESDSRPGARPTPSVERPQRATLSAPDPSGSLPCRNGDLRPIAQLLTSSPPTPPLQTNSSAGLYPWSQRFSPAGPTPHHQRQCHRSGGRGAPRSQRRDL